MTKKYALKVVHSDMTTRGGFKWSGVGEVTTAPDWRADYGCGMGLHAWLNGIGSMNCQNISETEGAIWLVLEVHGDHVDLGGKVKFQSATTLFAGHLHEASRFLAELSEETGPMIGKVATGGKGCRLFGGNYSILSGGPDSELNAEDFSLIQAAMRCNINAGDFSTINAQHLCNIVTRNYCTVKSNNDCNINVGNFCHVSTRRRSMVYAGARCSINGTDRTSIAARYGSIISAGAYSTVSGGESSTLVLMNPSGFNKVAVVGQNGIKPGVSYRLNDKNEFVEVK